MTLDSFYAIVSGTCFALVGLWWGVVQFNKDWLKHDETRALAGGIYLSFLIPGVMSLIAQVSGENKIIWRATFVIASALGMFSHAIDYAFFGINPVGHHLTSIILHGMNTFLVFLLVVQLMMKGQTMNKTPSPASGSSSRAAQPLIAAAVTALLFGIHPLHVESVAWLSERKDVLCAFFFLLALCSYLCYTSSIITRHQRIWFTACVMLSAAALMAKPMAVALPLILLLLDIYPLKRITLYPHTSNKNLSLLLE